MFADYTLINYKMPEGLATCVLNRECVMLLHWKFHTANKIRTSLLNSFDVMYETLFSLTLINMVL